MNYGWEGVVPTSPEWTGYTNSNVWYTIDALPGSDPENKEKVLIYIHPAPTPYDVVDGDYFPLIHGYRYFDQDAAGVSATFYGGQNLQFLPSVTVTCTGTESNTIRFVGSSTAPLHLFSLGDLSRGINISNGAIRLYQNGGIKFH